MIKSVGAVHFRYAHHSHRDGLRVTCRNLASSTRRNVKVSEAGVLAEDHVAARRKCFEQNEAKPFDQSRQDEGMG